MINNEMIGLLDPVDVEVAAAPTTSLLPPPPPPPPAVAAPAFDDDGENVLLPRFAERAYLDYAMSVVRGRALPSVEDGEKPVQKRILFAMREMGNRHDSPYKKSARIVGDVIGKYHPHGDSAVYEAAVRMAQNFTLRYPLIDGQGNFGSRDGDGPAAMRYTEIRLTKFAEEILLSELDKGTVDFRDNYDGSMQEPTLLPARLPVALLNGAAGIAVGMATDIPPHNLREVSAACLLALRDPTVSDDALLGCVKAPDFPGGGQIISTDEEIRKAYLVGRGSIRVRARWEVEQLARGQYRIAVTELPPNTSAANVLVEIEDLCNPKTKPGKKALTPEQQAMKTTVLAVLESASDDQDESHPVRIVLEPRSSKVSPDELMAVLLANTSMEGNVSINMVMIGRDGKPRQKGIPEVIREWVDFRMHVVERRLKNRLDAVNKRIHILDGRMTAFLRIEEIIKVIREADEPKAELISAFALTEIQAEDILEIRLRQLARLEGIKIERELSSLREEKDSLLHLLANEGARRELIGKEIESDTALFGDDRRTLIQAAEKVTAGKIDALVDDPVTVLVSRNLFVRTRNGHGIDRAAIAWKDGDSELAIIETRTTLPLLFLDGGGRVYTVRIADIPGGKGDGVPLSSLVDLQSPSVEYVFSAAPDSRLLIANSNGYGFVTELKDMVSRQKSGKAYVTIDAKENYASVSLIPAAATEVAVLSEEGRLLIYSIGEIKALSGGKGVVLMGLHDDELLLDAKPFTAECQVIRVQGADKRGETVEIAVPVKDFDHYRGKRARTGRVLQGKFKTLKGLVIDG